ncbi:hypothetical protein ACIA8R_46130 [Nonomuraea sp. NPDC051191]|uniref:hypothetical protein n=1 Tax=Nonomuraea sp. NPDC051191 TaxID=3364372 RepID=UPI003791F65B
MTLLMPLGRMVMLRPTVPGLTRKVMTVGPGSVLPPGDRTVRVKVLPGAIWPPHRLGEVVTEMLPLPSRQPSAFFQEYSTG